MRGEERRREREEGGQESSRGERRRGWKMKGNRKGREYGEEMRGQEEEIERKYTRREEERR